VHDKPTSLTQLFLVHARLLLAIWNLDVLRWRDPDKVFFFFFFPVFISFRSKIDI